MKFIVTVTVGSGGMEMEWLLVVTRSGAESAPHWNVDSVPGAGSSVRLKFPPASNGTGYFKMLQYIIWGIRGTV